MPRTAKVFMTNRSQAVRLPKEFQFTTDEVFIRKEGEDVILSPRPADWDAYLDDGEARPTRSWTTSRTCPRRSASPDGPLHARHRHLLLHHEAFEPVGAEAACGRYRWRTCACRSSPGASCSTALRCHRAAARTLQRSTAFLPYVEVLDLSDDAASHYAEIRADLKRRGAMIGANDLFIAAHARASGSRS